MANAKEEGGSTSEWYEVWKKPWFAPVAVGVLALAIVF
jgi:hypothetical protein